MSGFIKIHRSMIDWEWFTDVNTAHLWVVILMSANYERKSWQGKVIEPGSFVTSVANLSAISGLTTRQTRTSLEKLKMTNEIAIKTTNKYSVITVVKWAEYQCPDDCATNKMTSCLTNKWQTNDKQDDKPDVTPATTTKEYKEINKKRNSINTISKRKLGEYKNVLLTDDEIQKLYQDYGEFTATRAIEFLSGYIEEKGYKAKSHYLTIKRWVIKAVEERATKPQQVPRGPIIQNTPVYDDSNNIQFDEEELRRLLENR